MNAKLDHSAIRHLSFIICIASFLSAAGLRQSIFAQGTAFTYQGRLSDSGSPANGTYDMQFCLRTAASGGSAAGNTNTLPAVQASNGLFTVTLDFGPGIFSGNPLWLEIGVRTNGNASPYTTLSPRQQLTPSPYALYAPQAGIVTNGAITSTMLANSAVTSSKLADGAVTSQQLADTIALGTNGTNGRLYLYQTAAGAISMQLLGSTKQLRIFGDDSAQKVSLDASPGWGELDLLNNNSPSQFAAILTANGTGGGSLTLNNSNGLNRAVLFGANTGGSLNLFDGSGTNNVMLGNFGGGLLALNGTNGLNRATLAGLSGGGQINLYNASNAGTVSLNAAGNSWLTGGDLGLGTSNPQAAFQIEGPSGTPPVSLPGGQGGLLMGLQSVSGYKWIQSYNSTPLAINPLGNNVGIRTTSPAAPLHVVASSAGGEPNAASIAAFERSGNGYLSVLTPAGFENGILFASSTNNVDGGIIYNNPASPHGLQFRTSGNVTWMTLSNQGTLSLQRADGTVTISANPDDGTGSGLLTTSVLQITGGADLSEQFDIRDPPGAGDLRLHSVQPGIVVCIDPENPGQLVISTKAYDRTVAGIVSGAGGVNPGMLMAHHGTLANGKHPVALTGRVYCLADATHGAIQPGDLLTTSATPGHAMKVTDPARAQGSILGKAMGSLQEGKGLVLVLVTLQ